jgi:hypothetical protein
MTLTIYHANTQGVTGERTTGSVLRRAKDGIIEKLFAEGAQGLILELSRLTTYSGYKTA